MIDWGIPIHRHLPLPRWVRLTGELPFPAHTLGESESPSILRLDLRSFRQEEGCVYSQTIGRISCNEPYCAFQVTGVLPPTRG